jgi:hypothetical protein
MYVKLGSDTYLTLCFRVGFRYKFIWNFSKPNYFLYINFKSREFQMGNFQKYWSQNVGQDFIVLDFLLGGYRAGGKGVCGRSAIKNSYKPLCKQESDNLWCQGKLLISIKRAMNSSRIELLWLVWDQSRSKYYLMTKCFIWWMKEKNCIYNLFIIIKL